MLVVAVRRGSCQCCSWAFGLRCLSTVVSLAVPLVRHSHHFFVTVHNSLVLSVVTDALRSAGYNATWKGDALVLKNDNSWRRVAEVVVSTAAQRKRAADGSLLAVATQHRHPSQVVVAMLNAVRVCFADPQRYAKVRCLWTDAFTTLLPLLQELSSTAVDATLRERGDDFVAKWCARAVKYIRNNHITVTFYTHLLLHWGDRRRDAIALSPCVPLTPAHFGQSADESAWRFLRRWLTRLTTFNGGHSAAALASPSAVQLVQRSLMLMLLRWLRGVALWDGADERVIARPPSDFNALIALLQRLRSHYLPQHAEQQRQQLVTGVRERPVVSQAALNRFVLDQRALATEMERDLPPPEQLLVSLRESLKQSQHSRFDEQQRSISQRLQHTLQHTVDNTKK